MPRRRDRSPVRPLGIRRQCKRPAVRALADPPAPPSPAPHAAVPLEPQAPHPLAAWRANRTSPAVSGMLCARPAAVKRQVDRPDRRPSRRAVPARRRPPRPRGADQGTPARTRGAGQGLGRATPDYSLGAGVAATGAPCHLPRSRAPVRRRWPREWRPGAVFSARRTTSPITTVAGAGRSRARRAMSASVPVTTACAPVVPQLITAAGVVGGRPAAAGTSLRAWRTSRSSIRTARRDGRSA